MRKCKVCGKEKATYKFSYLKDQNGIRYYDNICRKCQRKEREK